jgi:hypothetical protein
VHTTEVDKMTYMQSSGGHLVPMKYGETAQA